MRKSFIHSRPGCRQRRSRRRLRRRNYGTRADPPITRDLTPLSPVSIVQALEGDGRKIAVRGLPETFILASRLSGNDAGAYPSLGLSFGTY